VREVRKKISIRLADLSPVVMALIPNPRQPPSRGESLAQVTSDQSKLWASRTRLLLAGAFIAGVVVGGVGILMLKSTPRPSSSQSPQPRRYASATPVPDDSSAIFLLDFSTAWTAQSKGYTALDGQLWVPEIKVVVKNMGVLEISEVYLRAVFLDEKGVITSESSESIKSIPPGYAKGPVFILGTVGYTSKPSLRWNAPATKWRYELYQGHSSSGPWKQIQTGLVMSPGR
jgi:hypothetical protein